MRTIGNVLWFVVVGLWSAVGWVVLGVLLFVLVVTAPFGRQCFKIANLTLWPMGRTTVDDPTAPALGIIGQVIWVVCAGWWLAIGYALSGVLLCVTVIGIPFGLQSFKLAVLSLAPFGRKVVSHSDLSLAA